MTSLGNKIFNIFLDILIMLVLVLGAVISITNITATANGGVPDIMGYSAFSIQTASMEPTIQVGDYIIVAQSDEEVLAVGDIISYFTMIEGERVVNTHRIVEVVEDGPLISYVTQGDNTETNQIVDESPVISGDIVGVYTGMRIPKLGLVMDFLSTQMGFFFIILLPVLLFTLYQIWLLVGVITHNKKVELLETMEAAASEEMKAAIISDFLAQSKGEPTE